MSSAYDIMAAKCPGRTVLNRIGARWTIFIVIALAEGPRRFTELKTTIEGITPKVLTESLRTLVADGLVERIDYAEQPPRVEYRLTSLGRSLLEPLNAVRAWAEQHVDDMLDARERNLDDAWTSAPRAEAEA
jgi:DNA-binding HxlR family transcriptional regulator